MLRAATPEDAVAIAHVLTAAHAAQEWQPRLHTREDDLRFVRERLLPTHEVWVADEDGVVVGYAALEHDVLDHLFVHPDAQGRGLGTALLDKTKDLRPGGFTLWTFQLNEQARRFYEARDLRAVQFADGTTNMEKLPDVRYEWRPPAARGSSER